MEYELTQIYTCKIQLYKWKCSTNMIELPSMHNLKYSSFKAYLKYVMIMISQFYDVVMTNLCVVCREPSSSILHCRVYTMASHKGTNWKGKILIVC